FASRNAVPEEDFARRAGARDAVGWWVMRTPHSSHPAIRLTTSSMSRRRDRVWLTARVVVENIVNSFIGMTVASACRAKNSTTASCATATSATHWTFRSDTSSGAGPYDAKGTPALTSQ